MTLTFHTSLSFKSDISFNIQIVRLVSSMVTYYNLENIYVLVHVSLTVKGMDHLTFERGRGGWFKLEKYNLQAFLYQEKINARKPWCSVREPKNKHVERVKKLSCIHARAEKKNNRIAWKG